MNMTVIVTIRAYGGLVAWSADLWVVGSNPGHLNEAHNADLKASGPEPLATAISKRRTCVS